VHESAPARTSPVPSQSGETKRRLSLSAHINFEASTCGDDQLPILAGGRLRPGAGGCSSQPARIGGLKWSASSRLI
jgi:hypothetical protein